MNYISKFFTLPVLTFIIATTAFADLSEATFDSSNCVTLSNGHMRKVSIPLPDKWKDGLKSSKISKDLREQVKDRFPFEDILAYYINPKRKTDYVAVMKLDDKAVSYNAFKNTQENYDKALKDGSAKAEYIMKMPGNHDKDFDKRFQFFPFHETNDHSFQFTLVGLTLEDLKIVYSISSHAIIWMHDRAFKVEVRTIATNQSNTMDKMTETRFFMSHWVETILHENGCDAHDMSNSNMVQHENETIDENVSQDEHDDNGKEKASESNASNNAEDETSSEDDKETSIIHDAKQYIWRPFIITTILIFVIYLLKKIRVDIEVKIFIVITVIVFFASLLISYFMPQIKDFITEIVLHISNNKKDEGSNTSAKQYVFFRTKLTAKDIIG